MTHCAYAPWPIALRALQGGNAFVYINSSIVLSLQNQSSTLKLIAAAVDLTPCTFCRANIFKKKKKERVLILSYMVRKKITKKILFVFKLLVLQLLEFLFL